MSIHEEKTFPGVKCEYHRGQNGWEISPSSWPTIIPETDFHEGFKKRCLLEKHSQVPSILISCSEFVNVTNIRDHSISQWNYFDANNGKKINTQAESEGYPGDIKKLLIRETFSSSVYLYQLFWIRKNKIRDQSTSQWNYNKYSSSTHYHSLISAKETARFFSIHEHVCWNLREDPRATTSFTSVLLLTKNPKRMRENCSLVFRSSSSASLSRKGYVLYAKQVTFENCMFP